MSDVNRLILGLILLSAYGVFCWFFLRNKHPNILKKQVLSTSNIANGQGKKLGSLLIAYASQSGTAAALASQSAVLLAGYKECQILPLNQVDNVVLAQTTEALFVVSTYGEGEAPDNARLFVKRFLIDSIDLDLSHVSFSVIALGDRVYQQFCAFGHQLYQGLVKLGAIPVLEPIELCASQSNDPAQALTLWCDSLGLNTKDLDSVNEPKRLSVNIKPATSKLSSWQLIKRQLLNPGSPGAGVYLVSLSPVDKRAAQWFAGDLIELTLSETELNQGDNAYSTGDVIRRKYSIASIAEQGVVELVVRQHVNQDGSLGLGSGWLTHAAKINSHLKLQIFDNVPFHGVERSRPMILIGSGTGIAGLRAHIKMRQKQKSKNTWLLFGERTQRYDSLFADEIIKWQQQGGLQQVDLSFSRDKSQAPYIQDVLLQHAEQVCQWVKNGSAIFVCGNRLGMAQGVDQCLQQILTEQDYQQLLTEGRYRRDVY